MANVQIELPLEGDSNDEYALTTFIRQGDKICLEISGNGECRTLKFGAKNLLRVIQCLAEISVEEE